MVTVSLAVTILRACYEGQDEEWTGLSYERMTRNAKKNGQLGGPRAEDPLRARLRQDVRTMCTPRPAG